MGWMLGWRGCRMHSSSATIKIVVILHGSRITEMLDMLDRKWRMPDRREMGKGGGNISIAIHIRYV